MTRNQFRPLRKDPESCRKPALMRVVSRTLGSFRDTLNFALPPASPRAGLQRN